MKKLLNKIKTITKGINRLQVLVIGLMMNLLVAVPAYAVPNPGVVFITDPEFAKTIAEWLLNITGLK